MLDTLPTFRKLLPFHPGAYSLANLNKTLMDTPAVDMHRAKKDVEVCGWSHAYPAVSHAYPAMGHAYPAMGHAYPAVSHAYPAMPPPL